MLVLVANEKGGVGKTTIAVNLAVLSALSGKETLLVDTDAQQSTASWSAVRHENEISPRITCITKTGKVGYDLAMLKEKYEVVVVDAGGRDSIEMRQAMAVADKVIIPIKPSQFDVWSLGRMTSLIKDVTERIDAPVNAFCFINAASSNPSVRETAEVREILEEHKEFFPTLNAVITERIAFRKAARDGLGVLELSKDLVDVKAVAEIQALYEEVFNNSWVPKLTVVDSPKQIAK